MIFAAILLLQREVIYTDRTVEIAVPVAGEAKHVSTVVSFPEDSLEALVAGWNEEDLSVERRRDRLFLKLLRRAEGDLHVVGSSGTLYRLYLRPADGAADGHVRIVRPSAPRSLPNAFDLIRAMRTSQIPEGVTARRASTELARSDRFVLTTRTVYDTPSYRGYVVLLENVGSETVRIDPSRFSGEGLDLIGAREMVVEPKRSTLVYLVYGK